MAVDIVLATRPATRFNVKMGQNTESGSFPIMQSPGGAYDAKVEEIAEIIDDYSAGKLMTITQALGVNIAPGPAPPDNAAILPRTNFNFINTETGGGVSVQFPYASGVTETTKSTVGQLLASALSGDLGTLVWTS